MSPDNTSPFIESEIATLISEAIDTLDLAIEWPDIKVEYPAQEAHGDFSTSIAMAVFSLHKGDEQFKQRFSSPRDFAQAVVSAIETVVQNQPQPLIDSVSIAGPGFINFNLNLTTMWQNAQSLINSGGELPKSSKKAGSAVIEYLSPNTNKPLHIGHLRNGALGNSVGLLLEEIGWDVHYAEILNDRGLHIMKSVWGYLQFGLNSTNDETIKAWQQRLIDWLEQPSRWLDPSSISDERLQKPDHFVGHWYTRADKYAEDESVQKAWAEMLQTWEQPDAEYHQQLRQLWQQMNDWFYEGSQVTTQRLGMQFDQDYVRFESNIYEAGRQIVLDATEKGVFTKLEDGAVKVELEEQFGLPDKVLLRRDGTGIYMTFDIELTRQRSQLGADKLIWVVGVDQKLYFQQLFAVCQMLDFGTVEDFYHFAYGMVRLPEGKMSSRKGRVIYADDLLDLAKEQAAKAMAETAIAKSFTDQEKESVLENVAIGAVKWTMLSQDPVSEITFNLEESVSFKGFAGPYIQYTAARCHSVLSKANRHTNQPIDILVNLSIQSNSDNISTEESALLRQLAKYFDTVKRSAENYAPHLLSVYLFELAQRFNTFYANCPILSEDSNQKEQTERRLVLTAATEAALNRGLKLLGITPVEKM